MKKNQFKKPPFSLDRSHWGDLAAQLAGQLRTAIETGYYSAGDILPPVRDLAMLLDVSKGIAEQAIAIIRNEGLISPRPAQGSVVLGRGERLWKGNVLIVTRTDGREYYTSVFIATLRALLVRSGWLVTQVAAAPDDDGKTSVFELETHLKGLVSLAVVIFGNPTAERVLSRSGIPFVTLDNRESNPAKGCVGHVRYDSTAAASKLAEAAARAGVKTVLQVGLDTFADTASALEAHGLRVSRLDIPVPRTGKNPESFAFAIRDAFLKKLLATKNAKATKEKPSARDAKGAGAWGEWPPDLIYFTNDHLCTGALAAFAAAGVRVPDDVRVATWANAGDNPVFERELTRTEMDPEDDAEKLAATILSRLEGRDAAFPATFGPTFMKGATL